MSGHFGFSYVGLIYLLMLFIPNIIWAKSLQIENDKTHENIILLLFERIGQMGCTVSVLMFKDYDNVAFSSRSVWLAMSFLLMIIYELCWIRYFTNKHREGMLYRSYYGIPVPLASLPVMAFLLLGIYGEVIWLIASAIIIGIGHIGIHIQHLKVKK
ncbi:MAG: hypothetical protein P0Y55_08320 [Candidatus Cohnella colombiensis]|uniref:Uncharacterized protein n=1 Tax=Candidatus Cohnella colombiensis TaxID=3121368 RepID=A0AA95EYV5_9BACL|nr:MAG: hypothetical protein P0Y55_08320 [Cohnella sp.]